MHKYFLESYMLHLRAYNFPKLILRFMNFVLDYINLSLRFCLNFMNCLRFYVLDFMNFVFLMSKSSPFLNNILTKRFKNHIFLSNESICFQVLHLCSLISKTWAEIILAILWRCLAFSFFQFKYINLHSLFGKTCCIYT